MNESTIKCSQRDDLISRKAAIEWFFRPYSNEESYSNLDVEKALNDIPAMDAVEVRHGKWEGDYPQATFRLKRCSICGTLAPEGWYCFFCGAKMDEEEEYNAPD